MRHWHDFWNFYMCCQNVCTLLYPLPNHDHEQGDHSRSSMDVKNQFINKYHGFQNCRKHNLSICSSIQKTCKVLNGSAMFDCQFKLSNIFSVSYDILKVMWLFGLYLYCTRILALLIFYLHLLTWDSVGFLGLPFHQEFVHEVILWYFLTLTESSITSNKSRSWNALMLCRTCFANDCFSR